MSKFLYIQDAHFSGKNPINYIGDSFSDSLIILEEVLELVKKHKVDAILDGGDLLDTAEPSYRVLDEIADRVEKAKISIFSLFGNHSQLYCSNEHSRYVGLAHLQKRSKYFNYFSDFPPFEDEMEADGYILKGLEYSHHVEEDIKDKGIIFPKTDAWKIAIVHAFVCPKKFPYASHVVCDDIKTNADIILVGHYHSEWEKKVGNTFFKDIGCLGRRSVTEHKITPKVLLIDTDKRELKEIKLKSAKKGTEIFDLSKLEEVKDMNQDIENFIKSLESTSFQGINLKDRLKHASKELNIEKKVVNYLNNKLDNLELK